MFVPTSPSRWPKLPEPPEGAEWAEPPRVIERLIYRADGAGFLEPGYTHKFVVPAEGGTPRQVTRATSTIGGTPVWSGDGHSLVFSANRHDDWEQEPGNSEVYESTFATARSAR